MLLWILLGLGGMLVICCGGGAVLSLAAGDDKNKDSNAAAPAEQVADPTAAGPPSAAATKAAAPAAAPGIGKAVRDGKFQFVVKSVKCGSTKVGNSLLNEKAQGMFCLVNVTVENIGDEPRTFAGSVQKAFDAKGREFTNDTEAEIYANTDTQTFFEEINPGNKITGMLVFDVPKGTKLTKLELHDSMFSGGVTVRLT